MSTIASFYRGNTVMLEATIVEYTTGQTILVDSVTFSVYKSSDFYQGNPPLATLSGTPNENKVYQATCTIADDADLTDYIVKVQAVKGDLIATDYMKFKVTKVDV